MMKYQCRACRCYLDPGEGDLCDDCRKRLEKEKALEQLQLNQSTKAGIATNPRTG